MTAADAAWCVGIMAHTVQGLQKTSAQRVQINCLQDAVSADQYQHCS